MVFLLFFWFFGIFAVFCCFLLSGLLSLKPEAHRDPVCDGFAWFCSVWSGF